jgi:hypothetical protein
MIRSSTSEQQAIVEPAEREWSPVIGATFYLADFSIYLRQRFQGMSISELASVLEVPESHALKYLDGHWHPSKAICKRLGLKQVCAIPGPEYVAMRSKNRLLRVS